LALGAPDKAVNIQLISDTEIYLSHLYKEGFEVSSDDPELHFRAMETFVTSLAMCTFSVLAGYGQRTDIGVDDLTIRIKWGYAEKPHRIEKIDMDIRWPEIPEAKLDVAMRAAATCTLHRTLEHSVEVETMIDR
jgi:uncharacterized OsmC-like protein